MSTPPIEKDTLDLKTQLFRFIVVGVLSGCFDFGLTASLQHGLGAGAFWAKSVGFIVGTTTAYLINRRWTFKADPSTKRLVAVWLLYLVTFGVQVGIYTGLSHAWSDSLVMSFLIYVIAQGTATVINFIVQRAVIFKLS